jgi:hypothetical protein
MPFPLLPTSPSLPPQVHNPNVRYLVLGQILDGAGTVGRRVLIRSGFPGTRSDVALEVEGVVDFVDLVAVLA